MGQEETQESQLTLKLQVATVTFHAPDTEYSVLKCKDGNGTPLTVTGTFPGIKEGSDIFVTGTWVRHPRYGTQLKADSWHEIMPETESGIRKYLSSGMVRGIGPVLAERLVDAFGKDTFDVIENHPERLKEVNGVGEKKIKSILAKWQEQKSVRDIMVFLKDHDVTDSLAGKIFRKYGDESIRVLKENPYRMADDIWGVGFRIADRLALNLGTDRSSPFRLQSGLRFALEEAKNEGHMFLPDAELVRTTAQLLDLDDGDVMLAEIEKQLNMMAGSDPRRLIRLFPGGETYLPQLYEAEVRAAARITRMLTRRLPLAVPPDIERIERKSGLSLAPAQRQAVVAALTSTLTIITGGPGTGKTTTVKAILTGLDMAYCRVLLASPTGKAAKRLEEATGRPAMTIHRLLEFAPGNGGFTRNSSNPLIGDALVIDEASMIDGQLLDRLLDAVPEDMRVIIVGDADQLPSVGAGNCLREMIACGVIPTVRLATIFRQAAGSDIIRGAHDINNGRMPFLGGMKDLWFVEAQTPEENAEVIMNMYDGALKSGVNATDIQVLTPMKRGPVGTEELNRRIQNLVNAAGKPVLKGVRELRVGDRVVNLKNDYTNEVFNGDQGVIEGADEEEGTISVNYDGKVVVYENSETDCLLHAWAMTVHRSQGSEFGHVITVMSTQHWIMLQRQLLYTAVTRAKQMCVITGSYKALAQAVHNNAVKHRYTLLGDMIRGKTGN